MLVLSLFFFSGATALVYQVLWSKYLSLMLGSTVQAQTVVLAIFMGGLAVGNRLFGQRAERFREPLSIYGYLEIAIGLFAFFFYSIYRAADGLFVVAGSAVYENTFLLLALKLAISFFLLILPTVLMGGTLPLMASWIQKQPGIDWGAKVGMFYAINSLGAVFGAGLAGFYLVQTFGMVASLQLVALANLVIGLVAVVVGRRSLVEVQAPSSRPASDEPLLPAPADNRVGWFGVLVACTGGASMGLEVLSSRALALIAGGSLQAFALVLMSFILGIGLGSVVIASSKLAQKLGRSTIYLLLLGAGTLIILNVVFIDDVVVTYVNTKYGLAANESGWILHQIIIALTAFVVLGIPAAFLGATVPLSIRLLENGRGSLAERVGRLLTWNTIGAVAGVLLTGFVLMPLFGLRPALIAIALLLMAIVLIVALRMQDRPVAVLASVLAAASLVASLNTGRNWQEILSAGVFRVRNRLLSYSDTASWRHGREIIFYRDAPDATVSVERSTETNAPTQITLRINGKADASTYGDLSTQLLLAHLPMAAKPDAKEVFVLGFGSGITAGALLRHPIEHVTIAENCQPVLQAGHIFNDWNGGVLTNSRTVLRNDDARAVLKLGRKKYDVIVSEPSNPWVAGVGSVFSREFYELASKHLTDGGVMAQWFHLYEMSDPIVLLVLRTFMTVFPHVEIWEPQRGDIVLLGSAKAWRSDPEHYRKIYDRPLVAQDLARIGLGTPEIFWIRQTASQRTAFAIPGDGPIQTDEFPVLEYAAPRAFFIDSRASSLNLYDERAQQSPLADSRKLQVLRSLPEQQIKDAFAQFDTATPELGRYIASLSKTPRAVQDAAALSLIAFRKPDAYPEAAPAPENASPERRELLALESKLLREDGDWAKLLDGLEAILDRVATLPDEQSRRAHSSSAALGAKFAAAHRDFPRAARLVQTGLAIAPSDRELHFLARLLVRKSSGQLIAETNGDRAPDRAGPKL
jgi:spermidine synthase